MFRLVAVGINVVDIYREQRRMYPGGNEYNVAWNTANLGGQASFMGVFADDPAGVMLASAMRGKGIDLSRSRFEHGSSGYAIVRHENGDRIFETYNQKGVTDGHPIRYTDGDLRFIARHDVACVSYASRQGLSDFRKLHTAGVPICHDFSDIYTAGKMKDYCPLMYFSFFSCSRERDESAVRNLLKDAAAAGTGIAVGTMGGRGALAFDGRKFYRGKAEQARVIDTMGAGDAYIAGFLYRYFAERGKGDEFAIPAAMREGAALAQKTVGFFGSLGFGYDADPDKLSMILNIG